MSQNHVQTTGWHKFHNKPLEWPVNESYNFFIQVSTYKNLLAVSCFLVKFQETQVTAAKLIRETFYKQKLYICLQQ